MSDRLDGTYKRMLRAVLGKITKQTKSCMVSYKGYWILCAAEDLVSLDTAGEGKKRSPVRYFCGSRSMVKGKKEDLQQHMSTN